MMSKFNLDDIFGSIADTELFEGSGTTTLSVGKRVPYAATINGISVPCYATLREAKLTRISMLEQTQVATGRNYWLATGIFKPVRIDLELIVEGETISLVDFLHQVAQSSAGNLSREEFILNARRIGFNFAEGMPLFWQQFGASSEGFKHLADTFKEAGAVDAISRISKPGRIKAAYDHKIGVPVTSFELGTVDRSKSPRNQGFLNLVDAQVNQFARILGLRKEAKLLKQQLEGNTSKLSQEQIKKINAQVKTLSDMGRQQMSNWAGAQKRIVNENGTFVEQDQYDPVSAPCGRFTLLIDGEDVNIDLWSNSIRANTTPVVGNQEDF
jgi:hypothetical protein